MIWSPRRTFPLLALLCWHQAPVAIAEKPTQLVAPAAAGPVIREYRSSRLHVRTDLPAAEARLLYERLEATLRLATQYWGKQPKGQIDCYVAHDLAAWTDAQLPHRLARVIISGVGGATIPKIVVKGKQARNQPTVYASSAPGVAEHELMHAYCIHTFGSAGPEWYKEGMAELAVCRSTRESGIQCSATQSESLRAGNEIPLAKILAVGSTRKRISASLRRMVDNPSLRGQHIHTSVWTETDSDNVEQARDEYLLSWAFCYMMMHNPNYSKRFRTLGNVFVADQRNAFDEFFAPVRDEIEFEYRQFLKHASTGYRVDLCAWDWDHRFVPLALGKSSTTRVDAGRGFQASGVTVRRGQCYEFRTDGRWSLSVDGRQVDADGDEELRGQLVGVVLNDGTLGDPFPLGAGATWRSTMGGDLYLRCMDDWSQISDNRGEIVVTVTGR